MNKAINSDNAGEDQAFLRPIYFNYSRNLPPDIARRAVFLNPICPVEDAREAHEKTVAGCEGASCAIREGARP